MLVLGSAWLTQGRRGAQRTWGDTARGKACLVSVCCFAPAGSPGRHYIFVSFQWRTTFLQNSSSITFIYPSVYDSMSLLEEVSQYSAYLQVKDLIGWTSPSCFNLSMTCLKAGDFITSEHILKRTAVLDIYFSLAWETQLIPFNQSPSGCSKIRGIWDIAVMNCLLFSEHAVPFGRASSDGSTVSILSEK